MTRNRPRSSNLNREDCRLEVPGDGDFPIDSLRLRLTRRSGELEHTEAEQLGDRGAVLEFSSADEAGVRDTGPAGATKDRDGEDDDDRVVPFICGVGARRPDRSYNPKQLA